MAIPPSPPSSVVASDVAYDATSWDSNTNVPTKNVIRDQIEAMLLSITATDLPLTGDGMDFPAATAGQVFQASGTSCYVGGTTRATGIFVNAPDRLLCVTTTAAGSYAVVGSAWIPLRRVISMPDGDRLVLLSGNTSITPVAGENGFGFVGNILWKVENAILSPMGGPKELIVSASGTLSSEYCYGAQIGNIGQTDNVNLTLGTPTTEMSFFTILGLTVSGKYFRFTPDANTSIFLDGTTTGDGKYVQIAEATKGAVIQFSSFKTGASAYDWFATGISGAWTAEA